jgi:DNA repair photolyase
LGKRIQFKVEKGRVLVPVGEPCSFSCRYCYTRGGEIGPARTMIETIIEELQAFAREAVFDTIQLGYDGDPFARPERGISLLAKILAFGKDVNFSTKAVLQEQTLSELRHIYHTMQDAGTVLSALISICCWESAAWIEPHTPTPDKRMHTIKQLKEIGIPTFIALRPILLTVSDEEYERVVDEGVNASCDGFIIGPLYGDEKGQFLRFLPKQAISSVPSKTVTVPWSAHSPVWTRYEDEERRDRLSAMIVAKRGRVFLSSAEAVSAFRLERARS